MRISSVTPQVRDKNRVNVSVDGVYRLSLDITQLLDLGIKVGLELTEEEFKALEVESQFGKVYTRALEYALTRPRSQKELRNYLYRKTREGRTKIGTIRPGVPVELTQRVFERLVDRGYVDDEAFAHYWIENRRQRQGVSRRQLAQELGAKGVDSSLVGRLLAEGVRSESDELQKVIAKKSRRYDDAQKLTNYLVRQGFSYDDVREALSGRDNGDGRND